MHDSSISDQNKDMMEVRKLEDYFEATACSEIRKCHNEFYKLEEKDKSVFDIVMTRNFMIMIESFIGTINSNPELSKIIPDDIIIAIHQIKPILERVEGFVAMVSPHRKRKE